MSNGSPPITSAPVPPSIPGITQPVIVSGGQSLPPSFPLGSAGTWLPPPQVGMGGDAPAGTPVVPPGTGTGIAQPTYRTGSGTVPTAASLFPAYTAAGPFQPIVLTNLMQIGIGAPPFTPGQNPPPVRISTAPNIPQLPWTGLMAMDFESLDPPPEEDEEPHKPKHNNKHNHKKRK